MATFYKRGAGTSINVDSDVAKTSQTNGSAARKFLSPVPPATLSTETARQKTNDEHVAEKADSLKNVASVADTVAQFARESLAAARAELSAVSLSRNLDVRTDPPTATSDSVDFQISELSKRVGESFPAGAADMVSLSSDLHASALQKIRQVRSSPKTFNGAVPNLENVAVSMDKAAGTVDCFKVYLRFVLPTSSVKDGTVRAVRVFRSTVLNPRFQRGSVPVLSVHGMDKLMSNDVRSRSKNQDYLSAYAHKLDQSGVPNAVSILNPVDPGTNLRISSVQGQVTGSARDDVSVSDDPRVVGQASSLRARSVSRVFSVNVDRPPFEQPGQPPSEKSTGAYREVAFRSLDRLNSVAVGDQTEYSYFDDTVSYGQGYIYYVTSIDRNMVESSRSKLVGVTVEGLRVPGRPTVAVQAVSGKRVAFIVSCDDALVEKFEFYRRDPPSPKKFEPKLVRSVSTPGGFVTGLSPSSLGGNGFSRIGESLNGDHAAGSVFYDTAARPGKSYAYRIYSVDVFGNKSESPWETAVSVPNGSTMVALVPPHVTAEVDSATSRVRLTIGCDDPKVSSLSLTRRDATSRQSAFVVPNQPSDLRFGNPAGGTSLSDLVGPVVNNRDASKWPALFQVSGSDIVFVDPFAKVDRVYQYKVVGYDRFGNSTSCAISQRVFVTRQPMIDTPVNLVAELVQGPGFRVGGVRLVWQDGNSDVSSEDRLGSQTSLADTSVRTLYQVQRKMTGEGNWTSFPLTPDLGFFDPTAVVLGEEKPGFRPSLVEENVQYTYRVAALQTGSFVSNFSDPVVVFSAFPASVPANFRVRPSDAKVSPMYVTLNWDTPVDSGAVDRWEIQRAVTNNFFAAGISVKDPSAVRSLPWADFRTVFSEGSRFRSSQIDSSSKGTENTNQETLLTGEHYFQDMSVSLGNTYVYRIRAVGVDGSVSLWAFRGARLTDTASERRLSALLSEKARLSLTKSGDPVALVDSSSGTRSLDLRPTFSVPRETGVPVSSDDAAKQLMPDPVLKTGAVPDVRTAQQNRVKFGGL